MHRFLTWFLLIIPLCAFSQEDPIILEYAEFGDFALTENLGQAALVVLQTAIEQAPQDPRIARLYSKAQALAQTQALGTSSLRMSILNAALKAYDKGMYRASRSLLVEFQRLDPENRSVHRLLTNIDEAIARGSATYYQPRTLPVYQATTPIEQPAPSTTRTTAPSRDSALPPIAPPSQASSYTPTRTTLPNTSSATNTRENRVESSSGYTSRNTSTTPTPAPQSAHSSRLPQAFNPNSQTLAQQQARFTEPAQPQNTQPRQTQAPRATAPTPPLSANRYQAPLTQPSAANDYEPFREYPGYDSPYVIPTYKKSHLEQAEIDIISRWRDEIRIDQLVPRGEHSLLKIGKKVFRLGDMVNPAYYIYWRGFNPHTRTLFFVDRRGNLYKKSY